MKYDKPLVAALIGFLSTIVYEIFTRILMLLGFGKYSLYQLDSFVVTLNRPVVILGLVISSIVAMVGAILFYYALEKLQPDYLVIKSILFSLLIWAFLETVFAIGIEGRFIQPRPISDYIIHMFGSIVFGITMGLLFKRYILREQ